MINRFFNRPWFYRILALFLAILLVIYIDNTQLGFQIRHQTDQTQQTASRTTTISVPLQVNVDTDRFFATGYPEKIKITLSGTNSLVTSAVNTQNFRAYVDLSQLSVGKSKVKVKVSGLPSQIAYSVKPSTVTVDLQKRKSRSMPVQIEYNENAIPSPYRVGSVVSDPEVVTVTGARAEVKQIDRIVASVTLPNNLTKSYTRQVMLTAVDSKNRQLNVIIEPSTVKIRLPIYLPSKKLPIKLVTKNEATGRFYSVSSKTDSVTVYGNESALKKLKSLNVQVDLKNVTESKAKKVSLSLPKGVVSADTSSITVEIKVGGSNSIKTK